MNVCKCFKKTSTNPLRTFTHTCFDKSHDDIFQLTVLKDIYTDTIETMTTRCYDILEITDEYFLSACPQKRREMVIMGIHVHRNIPRHELRIPTASNSEIDELKQLHAQHIERKDHSIQLLNDEIVRLRSDIQTQLENERTRIEERDMYVKQQLRRLNEEN